MHDHLRRGHRSCRPAPDQPFQFSGDSSPDCTEGAGELLDQVDDDHLRYTTDYSDAVGTLQRG